MINNKLKLHLCFISNLIKEIFIICLVFFLTLLFLEDLKPYFVSAYINLKVILLICFVSGIITLLTSKFRQRYE